MKKIILMLLAFFVIAVGSAQTRKIDIKKSSIIWTGKKITGEHKGSLLFKSGVLYLKNKKLNGGTFTVDMTTLTNTDQTGSGKEKLEGHLKSADFFATNDFETSKLVFKTVKDKGKGVYGITGELTIKGRTNTIAFDLVTKAKSATADLVIDRTRFGIQYGSGSFFDDLGDRTIYDEFELNVNLFF